MDIVFEAQRRTAEEFLELYDRSQSNAEVKGRTVLIGALTNTDPNVRARIVTVLLDDGADARATLHDGTNALHALFGSADLDPELEAPVLRRLIEGGADVNAVAKKFGTPLQVLMGQFRYTDDVLGPFYDVLFDVDDLDPLVVGAYGKSAYAMAVKSGRRHELRARIEQFLRDHQIQIPEGA